MAATDANSRRLYQQAAPGSIANLKLTTQPPRTAASLGKRQVLVEVAYAGLNPADYRLVELGLVSKAVVRYPRTPGMDYSGRVLAVADDVPNIKAGDRVFGRLDPLQALGSLSEIVVADYEGVAVLPENVSLEQAGGVGTAALTAYQTIVPSIQPGDKVFINGGGGGTGTFGIQIAKAAGAHVTTSVSTAKAALAKQLGADEIIDYKTTPDVIAAVRGSGPSFALIVDNVGKSPEGLFGAASDILLPGGRFISISPTPTLGTVRNAVAGSILPTFLGGSKFKYETPFTKQSHADLEQLATWMREGKVKTIIDTVYDFEKVPEAYEKLKQGSSTGKLVVRVNALE